MGLHALLQELRDNQIHTILDLGPALGVNVDFWSRFSCRLHFQDFYDSLASEPAGESNELGWDASFLARALPFTPGTQFDVILCWDLLNYLSHEQVAALLAYLARYCKPGSILFALFWLAPRIPARPITFKIVDREHMEYIHKSPETRANAGYQPRDVARLSEDLQVSNSFLLRNGIQEYLLVYRGANHAPQSPKPG
jgi:hypothetical protein